VRTITVEPKIRDFIGAGILVVILVALVAVIYLAAMHGAAT
jgi:hypothetical protein